ncbi:MAG: CHAT domain-containing protein, partial [candidate division NC10 bacterium]
DNPLFSTLRLGDTQLSLFDLYHLRLPCELVTLSGCGPGLHGGGNGDELVGMIRGFLYAGAQTVMTPLWNAPGPSTSQLLQAFYRRVQQASDRSEALQKAMGEVREAYPHPYYWAPFVLHGKIKAAEPI